MVHDFVIVGAGFAGATTAWHLAQAGVADLLVLEQEEAPGVHSSGRNAGFIRERADHAVWQALLTEGSGFLRKGELARFDPYGSVLLGLGDDDVQRWVPPARGHGLWCPNDGIIDVAALLEAYLKGTEIRTRCRLERWTRDGDLLRLETNQGEILTRVLVNAAGAWAGRLGDLPIEPLARHVFVTAPLDVVDPTWPFVWDVVNDIYFRPESGGLLMSPCDETATEPGVYVDRAEALETLAERVARLQPGLGDDLPIAHRWVGHRTFASDRAPVIGFDPRESRLFHVCGLGGHGVTSSPAVGALAARKLLDGSQDRPDLDPARFA